MAVTERSSKPPVDRLADVAAPAATGAQLGRSGYWTADKLRAQLNVTSFTVAAGNTLDVVIEDTLDGVNWHVIGAFTQRTAAGREAINITTPFADTIRVRATIGGTPNAAYTVDVFAK